MCQRRVCLEFPQFDVGLKHKKEKQCQDYAREKIMDGRQHEHMVVVSPCCGLETGSLALAEALPFRCCVCI